MCTDRQAVTLASKIHSVIYIHCLIALFRLDSSSINVYVENRTKCICGDWTQAQRVAVAFVGNNSSQWIFKSIEKYFLNSKINRPLFSTWKLRVFQFFFPPESNEFQIICLQPPTHYMLKNLKKKNFRKKKWVIKLISHAR